MEIGTGLFWIACGLAAGCYFLACGIESGLEKLGAAIAELDDE